LALARHRTLLLVMVLVVVVLAGSVDGGLYLHSKCPWKSSCIRFAGYSAAHPFVGLAFPVIALMQGSGIGAILGLLLLVPLGATVFAARRFALQGQVRALLWVAVAGFASYVLSTRLLYGAFYSVGWN
jgi:hypothetical protein